MKRMTTDIKTIDQFIANYPKNVQDILQKIRQTIHAAVPEAKEKISYGIPTFTLNDKNLVHFSAYEHHIGFYPGAGAIVTFKDDLEAYETSKGTVQLSLDRPIPYNLIKKITLYRVAQHINKEK